MRAARYRAAAAAESAAASTDIVLPFKGTMLPVLRKEQITAAPRTAASTSPPSIATPTSPTTASTVKAAASAASPKLVRPVKAFQTHPRS